MRKEHFSPLSVLCRSNKDHFFPSLSEPKLINPQFDWNLFELCGLLNIWHNGLNFWSAPYDWIVSDIAKLSLDFLFQIQQIKKVGRCIRSHTDYTGLLCCSHNIDTDIWRASTEMFAMKVPVEFLHVSSLVVAGKDQIFAFKGSFQQNG